AAGTGHGGGVFVLEMGPALRIVDLAPQMIPLSGFEPHEDVEIVFTGLAPRGKLHQERVSPRAEGRPTHPDPLPVPRPPARPHPARTGVLRLPERPPQHADAWLPMLEACVEAGHVANAVALLEKLVPAYRPSAALLSAAGPPGSHLALPATRVA